MGKWWQGDHEGTGVEIYSQADWCGSRGLSVGAQAAILAVMVRSLHRENLGRFLQVLIGEQGGGWGRIQAERTTEQMSIAGTVECSRHVWGTASGLLNLGRAFRTRVLSPHGSLCAFKRCWGRSKATRTALGSEK